MNAKEQRLGAFEARLRGDVVRRGGPGYEDARRVYNGMIDRRPSLIARCADAADVIESVRLGADEQLAIAIRGGGHNGAGLGVCDDGIVIDLSRMRGVRVDLGAQVVRVEGGCLWRDVDHATHAFGLAVPSGIVSSTGVGGLTLGGGTGHLTRRYGLTIDSLLSADVVLADGRLVHTSEAEHPELFWALRGGGGNFGVVTSFELKLHPVRNVVGGPTLWPLERAREVLQWYRELIVAAEPDLNGFFAFLSVPAAPPFPTALHGQAMCGVVWCFTGPAAAQDEAFAPVRAMKPALFGVQEMPLPTLQGAFDALYPPGLQWYWRADFVGTIPDAAIDEHIRFGTRMPTPHSTMHLYPTDGAAHRVSPGDTAFSFREANWNQVIVGVDPDPANNDIITRWTKEYWDALHPYSLGGAYVNFLMDDEGHERVRTTYRDNYPRLAAVKRQYDPDNRFHVNQNIPPAPLARAERTPRGPRA